jgi:hypothetical protein
MKILDVWTGGVAQVVEYLLCKCEALSSNPLHQYIYTCIHTHTHTHMRVKVMKDLPGEVLQRTEYMEKRNYHIS